MKSVSSFSSIDIMPMGLIGEVTNSISDRKRNEVIRSTIMKGGIFFLCSPLRTFYHESVPYFETQTSDLTVTDA